MLGTSDINRDFQKAISEGAKILKRIHDTPWSKGLAYLIDLNGIIVSLNSGPSEEIEKMIKKY